MKYVARATSGLVVRFETDNMCYFVEIATVEFAGPSAVEEYGHRMSKTPR
jgi:hypothetical protein